MVSREEPVSTHARPPLISVSGISTFADLSTRRSALPPPSEVEYDEARSI